MAKSESVTCPWCAADFDIVPTSSAGSFRCPSCGDEASLASLRNPDLRPNAMAIAEATANASTQNAFRHTVAYVFKNKKGEEKNASGVLVKVGERYFLATVAHTEPRGLSDITFVKKSKLVTPQPLTGVIRRLKGDDDAIDVAAFELAAQAVPLIGLEPIGIDRICDKGPGNPNMKARVIGFPWTYILSGSPPNQGVRRFHALSYGCEPIESTRWKAITTQDGALDKNIHIVFEFNPDVIEWTRDLPVPSGLPKPHGMSGGGIWQRPKAVKENKIWSACDFQLFGIQSSWLYEKGFLRAVQIIHWLKLIADEYPELRSELQDRFPRLKQT